VTFLSYDSGNARSKSILKVKVHLYVSFLTSSGYGSSLYWPGIANGPKIIGGGEIAAPPPIVSANEDMYVSTGSTAKRAQPRKPGAPGVLSLQAIEI
jgi:hypothetical protein